MNRQRRHWLFSHVADGILIVLLLFVLWVVAGQ